MIRITKPEERSHTIIAVDGQISGDTIAVVETCCSQAESYGKPVHLLLRDVTTVDQSGQTLLRRLAARGIHIVASRALFSRADCGAARHLAWPRPTAAV